VGVCAVIDEHLIIFSIDEREGSWEKKLKTVDFLIFF
jgi:hypothetical protein